MELRSGDQDRVVEMLGQAMHSTLAGDVPNGLQQLHDPRF
jgi:hypothetical protein